MGHREGLPARLDACRNDGRCRLRAPNAIALHAIFTRLANSLFMEWRSRQPNARHLTTTDFAACMAENHDRRALAAVTVRSPRFHPLRE